MSRRFGGEPWEVDQDDLEWLRGAAAASTEPGFGKLIAAVEEHNRVRVWREY